MPPLKERFFWDSFGVYKKDNCNEYHPGISDNDLFSVQFNKKIVYLGTLHKLFKPDEKKIVYKQTKGVGENSEKQFLYEKKRNRK